MLKLKLLTLAGLSFCSAVLAEPVIHKIAIRENLEFLEPGREERMDLYYPADPRPGEKFPGIVIIHGGSWIHGIRNAEREINIGSNLARMGYVCISIDYRLATSANLKKYGKVFPVNIQDCKKAVQWLRKNAGELRLDPAKIGSIGGSAGGHLAALLAVAGPETGLEPQAPYPGVDSSVQACINLYGVMDFAGFRTGKPSSNKIRLMGSKPEQNRKDWLRMSPIEQIDPKDPPMLQIHAKADTTVPYQQAVIMKQVLDQAGVYNELILLDGFGHVFNLQRWRGRPLPEMVRRRVLAFYDRFLKGLSESEAAERFAALKDYEKKHSDSSHYGILDIGSGRLEKTTDKGMTVVRAGSGKFFGTAFDMQLEKTEPASAESLRDGMKAVVQGKISGKARIECGRIILSSRYPGKIPGRSGTLRKREDGWVLATGKNTQRKLVISDKTELYTCVPAKLSDLKPGQQVIALQARDYGDSRKVCYGLFAR